MPRSSHDHGARGPLPTGLRTPFEFHRLEKDSFSKAFAEGGPGALKRGELVEITVQLEPDPMYELATLTGSLTEMVEISDELDALTGSAQIRALGKLLSKLLIGQVPVRGALQLTTGSQPVQLQASLEAGQFWVDPRRVLFDAQNYTVLARVSADGPSKSAHGAGHLVLLERRVPGIRDMIEGLNNNLDTPSPGHEEAASSLAVAAALERYAADVGVENPVAAASSGLTRYISGGANAVALDAAFNSVQEISAAPPAPDDDISRPDVARKAAGIDVTGALQTEATKSASPTPQRPDDPNALRAEVIAIYW